MSTATNQSAQKVTWSYQNLISCNESLGAMAISGANLEPTGDGQDITMSGTVVSEIYRSGEDWLLVLQMENFVFDGGILVNDDQHSRQLFKLRMRVGLRPLIPDSWSPHVDLKQYIPQTQQDVTDVSVSTSFSANIGLDANGPNGSAGTSVSKSVSFKLPDYGLQTNTPMVPDPVMTDADPEKHGYDHSISWTYYMAKTEDNNTVSDTLDKDTLLGEIVKDETFSVAAVVRPIPNMAKKVTFHAPGYAVYRLGGLLFKRNGIEKIQFQVCSELVMAGAYASGGRKAFYSIPTEQTYIFAVDLSEAFDR